MTPRLSIIAASIRKALGGLAGDIGKYADEYWNSVVLALRGNVPVQDFKTETVLNMHMDGADPDWSSVVLGMHMGGGEVDPYWSNVSLLMLMNGTNASTAIGDVTGKTVTVGGNTQISTTQSKFGGASAYFDGTGDYLLLDGSTGFEFGSADFTIEFWVKPSTITVTVLFDFRPSGINGYYPYLDISASGILGYYVNSVYRITGTTALTAGNWYHISLCRASGVAKLFVNGSQDGSPWADNAAMLVGASRPCIGGNGASLGSNSLNGYIDNLRITKGVARYTDTFTPPNREFPAGATTIYDVKGHPVTVNGNTAIVATQSRFGGYSAYFDGTGDYLSTPTTSDLAFGTADYTVEWWVYLSALGTERCLLDTRAATTDTGLYLYVSATNYPTLFGNNAAIVTGSSALAATTWYHLAAVKSSGTVTLYLNGTSIGSAANAYSVTCPGSVVIGRKIGSTSNDWSGYLDDLRITKGVAKYTANFTPPSRAFPHDVAFYDEKGLVPTVTGSPTVSTGTLKYGYGSASLNGTTDYLTFDARSDFGFGTGDFTLEAWVKTSAVGTLLDFRNYASDYGHFYLATGGYLAFDHTYGAIVGTTSVTDNNWHHVAFVRYNNILTLFIDGADSGAAIANANIGSNRQARIGAKVDGTNFFAGNIDQLRLTKVARYVGEFTPQKYLFEDANNNVIWRDETGINTVTANGNATIYTGSYKYGNGSMYFDGTGDFLAIPTSTNWDFGNGDFTLECWIYKQSGQTDPHLVSFTNAGITVSVRLQIAAGGQARGSCLHTSANYGAVTGTTVLANNTWYHLAYIRHGNAHHIAVNGVIETTTIQSHTIPTATLVGYIGHLDGITASYAYTGFIDDVRVTKGIARYVSNFTPPARQNANYGLPAIYDPYWDAVVLGMHMDGADMGVTFTDVKGKTVSVFGNTQTKTATKKFGTASAYFDGTGDYLETPNDQGFVFGSGDFTIEAWVNVPNVTGTKNIVSRWSVGNASYHFALSGSFLYLAYASGGAQSFTGTTASVTANTWAHVAVCRSGSTIRLFVNGVADATTASFAGSFDASTSTLRVGLVNPTDGAPFLGYIDDLRITKGVARYTANFQPAQYAFPEVRTPVKTHLDPHYDSVVLNMHMNGPSGSAAFVDEIGKVVTAYGNTALSTTQSKFGGVSAYFDGTGDYLSVATSSAFGFGIGDFTVEAWIYPSATTGADRCITSFRTSLAAAERWTFFIDTTAGKLAMWDGSTLYGATGTSVTVNQWNHVACVRAAGVLYVFLNGVLDFSMAYTIDLGSSKPLGIGGESFSGGSPFNGYIDDLRITKGVARYTQNFTVPALPNPDFKTAPPATDPYWKNVVLHMPMNGADGGTVFTDTTGLTSVSSVLGNTQTKVAQYRFGTASAYFDGVGDALIMNPSSGFNLGTSDFTIELFVNMTASGSGVLFQTRSSSQPFATGFINCLLNNYWIEFKVWNGTAYVTLDNAGGGVPMGAWHHIAAVRSGTTMYLFLNGILIDTASYSGQVWSSTTSLSICGDTSNYSNYFNGYIDDFRITKGVARYTANFTPPSLPNPVGYDPYAPNVVLHLPMNTDFTDGTGKTVTVSGNTAISTTTKKFGVGSGYFDGSGDCLHVASSVDFAFGTGDFTVEAWINSAAATGGGVTFDKVIFGGLQNIPDMSFFMDNGTLAPAFWDGTTQTSSSIVVPANTWTHVAFVRASGILKIFVNGVQGTSVANTTNFATNSVQYIGGDASVGNRYLTGYIDDLRITKGVARYTANFTPPREPFSLT